MLKAIEQQNGEVSANQAYKIYANAAGDAPKLSFKDWLAKQKADGNFGKLGVIYDKVFGPKTETKTNSDIAPSDTKDTKVEIWGMSPWLAIPLALSIAVAVGYGIKKGIEYYKAKNAAGAA